MTTMLNVGGIAGGTVGAIEWSLPDIELNAQLVIQKEWKSQASIFVTIKCAL